MASERKQVVNDPGARVCLFAVTVLRVIEAAAAAAASELTFEFQWWPVKVHHDPLPPHPHTLSRVSLSQWKLLA